MLAVSGVTITVILFAAALGMGLSAYFFFLWAMRSGQFKNLNKVADRHLELESFQTTEDYDKQSGGSNGRRDPEGTN
jgi:cbb3-type cytochrome oxidase maturation protein